MTELYNSPLVEIHTGSPGTTLPEPDPLTAHIDRFHRRLLEDVLLEATAAYWHRRAETFALVGTPTCDTIAANCDFHARLVTELGLDAPAQTLLDLVLSEVPT